MAQGKSTKPDHLDGRKNGQSQMTRKTNEVKKQMDKKDKEMKKEMKKFDKFIK